MIPSTTDRELARGRILAEDVALVRERVHIEEIVGEHVVLRPAGSGSLNGLCPFHDERSPSFHVRPQVGHYHCFGCGEGGDVISFIQQIDGLTFVDAVEYLAGRAGITLRYEQVSGGTFRGEDPHRRRRLIDAHRVAQAYYAAQLLTPEAGSARAFLAGKGFGRPAAEQFGVGYAPRGWSNLQQHLHAAGFTDHELLTAGLLTEGSRGPYDRFRGRLMWPIRDVTGATIGFGARRLYDDDPGPKYLNTPETPLYKKAQVLYGLDLAKRAIAGGKRIVVVEGYTDVMAMHLSGEETAVATCGTAFGADHARVVRRLMGEASAGQLTPGAGGEVIFVFDGDDAGQKAAVRAFGEDQRFTAQTFVAVAADGMDPCEVRVAGGEHAVRSLVASRRPLFEFVIRRAIDSNDTTTAEGRVRALRQVAPIVASIRDAALRPTYVNQLADWIGMDLDVVRRAVSAARPVAAPNPGAGTGRQSMVGAAADDDRGDVGSDLAIGPRAAVERAALEVALQRPELAQAAGFDDLAPEAFTIIPYVDVRAALSDVGGVAAAAGGQPGWLERVIDLLPAPVRPLVTELAVGDLPAEPDDAIAEYVAGVLGALESQHLADLADDQRARLVAMSTSDPRYRELFTQLLALESRRQELANSL